MNSVDESLDRACVATDREVRAGEVEMHLVTT